jgi:hypothetical protein
MSSDDHVARNVRIVVGAIRLATGMTDTLRYDVLHALHQLALVGPREDARTWNWAAVRCPGCRATWSSARAIADHRSSCSTGPPAPPTGQARATRNLVGTWFSIPPANGLPVEGQKVEVQGENKRCKRCGQKKVQGKGARVKRWRRTGVAAQRSRGGPIVRCCGLWGERAWTNSMTRDNARCTRPAPLDRRGVRTFPIRQGDAAPAIDRVPHHTAVYKARSQTQARRTDPSVKITL